MPKATTYVLVVDSNADWLSVEDGVVLFNQANCNTVLFHPILNQLRPILSDGAFTIERCIASVGMEHQSLVNELLHSLEELAFINRTSH